MSERSKPEGRQLEPDDFEVVEEGGQPMVKITNPKVVEQFREIRRKADERGKSYGDPNIYN